MTDLTPAMRHERGRIWALALVSVVLLTAVGLLRVFVPPAIGPRVNIRWANDVDDAMRVVLEQRLKLLAGEQVEGATWLYDLGDPSPLGVKALIAEPAVADTHHLDRTLGTVSDDAPRGTTRIRDGHLNVWRDSPLVSWLVRLSLSVLSVSAIWLATSGRSLARPATPRR